MVTGEWVLESCDGYTKALMRKPILKHGKLVVTTVDFVNDDNTYLGEPIIRIVSNNTADYCVVNCGSFNQVFLDHSTSLGSGLYHVWLLFVVLNIYIRVKVVSGPVKRLSDLLLGDTFDCAGLLVQEKLGSNCIAAISLNGDPYIGSGILDEICLHDILLSLSLILRR